MSDFTWATMRAKVLFLASLAPSVHSIPDDRERLKAIYLPTLRRRTGMRRYDPTRSYGTDCAWTGLGRTRSFPSAVACRRVGHPRSWQPTETPPPTFDARLRGAYAQDVP